MAHEDNNEREIILISAEEVMQHAQLYAQEIRNENIAELKRVPFDWVARTAWSVEDIIEAGFDVSRFQESDIKTGYDGEHFVNVFNANENFLKQ